MAIYDYEGNAVTADVVVDDTLTQTGQAADAKKVGDELQDIQDQIDDIINGDEVMY